MGKREDFLQALDAATPALRRYARALCAGAGAGPAAADDLVQAALERAGARIRAKDMRPANDGEARFSAYAALTELAGRELRGAAPARPSPRLPAIVHGLADLPFDERAALLLVALEGFGYDDAARVTGASREATLARLMRARAALAGLELRPLAPSDGARRAPAHLRVVK
jgi:RNA polymerase sigma-70 factor (ECF subfamily)